jgi:hypothetical protein
MKAPIEHLRGIQSRMARAGYGAYTGSPIPYEELTATEQRRWELVAQAVFLCALEQGLVETAGDHIPPTVS